VIGELVDDVLSVNTEMWHKQEVLYDSGVLESMSKEEIIDWLRFATRLNLERNNAIDRLDLEIERTR
jgi:hypothetical protein